MTQPLWAKCLDQCLAHREGSVIVSCDRPAAGWHRSGQHPVGEVLGKAVEERDRKQEAGRGRGRGSCSETGHWAGGRGAAWHYSGSACSLARGPHDRLHRQVPAGRQAAVANLCHLRQAWLEPAHSGEWEILPFSRAVGSAVQPCKTRSGARPAVELRSPSTMPAASGREEGRCQAQVQPRRATASGPKFRKR